MDPVTALTRVLPHRLLSSLARRLAYSRSPRTSRWLIDTVVRRFDVDLTEAADPDPRAYESFNAFFKSTFQCFCERLVFFISFSNIFGISFI